MSSSVQRKRVRKTPEARRAEIVRTAARVALTEGLECVTLRRIAEELAVRPGLISHYFPSAEDLVAEAFAVASTGELDSLLPAERPHGTPAQYLARYFALSAGEAYDDISRLWINARHLSRYRPVLRDRVAEQERASDDRLEGLIREGVERGEFRTDDPRATAIQILVVLDGLGAHANTDRGDRPEAVTRMAVTTAERELGLVAGALTETALPVVPG
ncbi:MULTISPECIES: TetR/AcrR family transcriptional regulator [unclassified Streptomyces]|uniref:TetR/AcrR family transcriptional regulator n=1 Tax=unclassified Streptomyces TaxID=2593676 RepID=UPI0006B0097F|nr:MULTISPECIES: TetR family transcriptional regulator C-terminal domain-containing protein [unclassified Streptomyces]KOX16659.1 TetR family transcriptional regulator [Streptomyces sp. NRRL F-6491]KOX51253.1 TetR family transcriptional regulator [Streptomyces sp. NRRL F-6492]